MHTDQIMLNVEKLRKRPQHFLRFTGLSVSQFDRLLGQIGQAYPLFNANRLARPDRKRQVGGGSWFRLSLPDRTLLALVFLRLYLTNDLLGYLFGLDASNISRNLRTLLPLLEQLLPVPAQPRRHLAPKPPAGERHRKIGSLDELLKHYPDLREIIVDATEQPINRPQHKVKRKNRYSGKKKRHTRKVQMAVIKNGLICHLSKSVGGRTHDLTLFHRSGIERQLPDDWQVAVDKGYMGIVKHYPKRAVAIPKKPSKHHPLTVGEKRRNRRLAKRRIVVEHAISRVKKYQVMGSKYRHGEREYDQVCRTVCGLVNLRTQERLAQATA
ncbi:MAG: transposase family protein [Blastocatellia bacterium]